MELFIVDNNLDTEVIMKDNKVFIPLTLDSSTKETFGKSEISWGFLCIILTGTVYVATVFLKAFLNDMYFPIPSVIIVPIRLIAALVIIYIIRKKIIHEDELFSIYLNQKEEIVDLKSRWQLFSIEGDKMTYLSGAVGKIVKCRLGYLYNRGPDHEEEHRSILCNTLNTLFHHNFTIKHFDMITKGADTTRIDEMLQVVSEDPDENIKTLGIDIFNYQKLMIDNIAYTHTEYYLIIASDIETTSELDISVDYFKDNLSGSLYEYVEILDTDGIINAIKDIEHLNGLDVEHLCKTVSEKQTSYIEIIKCVYDNESDEFVDSNDGTHIDEYELAYSTILNQTKVQDEDDEDII